MRKNWKGSYTVEAAFIFPILFLVISMVLQHSILLYEKTEKIETVIESEETFSSVQRFWQKHQVDAIKSIIFDKGA